MAVCCKVLATLHIFVGLSMVASGVIYYEVPSDINKSLPFFYGGTIFISTGIVGILIYEKRMKIEMRCIQGAYLVLNIVSMCNSVKEMILLSANSHFPYRSSIIEHILGVLIAILSIILWCCPCSKERAINNDSDENLYCEHAVSVSSVTDIRPPRTEEQIAPFDTLYQWNLLTSEEPNVCDIYQRYSQLPPYVRYEEPPPYET